jgi:hypothetical protein
MKEFILWYKNKYTIDINSFLMFKEYELQIIIFAQFIADKYNLGFHADPNSIVIYFIDPYKSVNELLARAKDYGFKNQYKHYYDLETVSMSEAYKRALLKVIKIISEPF